MLSDVDVVVAAALDLARAARWERAFALLDAVEGERPSVAVAAAEVAYEKGWWGGREQAADRLAAAEKAAPPGWELEFLRLRFDYQGLVLASGTFEPGPSGKDPAAVADLENRAGDLHRNAPGEIERGWAAMYRGLIADNVCADRRAAPRYYREALATGGDDLLTWEALRHLGDHHNDDGDRAAALDHWQRAAALGAAAGKVTGTLSQQMLLATLRRATGDEPAAAAIAAEVARWSAAIGATRLSDLATGFLSSAGTPGVPVRETPAARSRP
jgi:hypothetical protein